MNLVVRYILVVGESLLALSMLGLTIFLLVSGPLLAAIPSVSMAFVLGFFTYRDIQVLRTVTVTINGDKHLFVGKKILTFAEISQIVYGTTDRYPSVIYRSTKRGGILHFGQELQLEDGMKIQVVATNNA